MDSKGKDIVFPEPFFTVIIAAYNRERLITRALDSLIGQREKDWDAIVVDDGSTDGTGQRILPYIKYNKKIRYLKQSHSGMPNARNKGVRSAIGRYVTFLDSDDEYDPAHLWSRKRIIRQNNPVRFLHGGVKVLGKTFVPDRFDITRMISLDDCIIGGTFFIERRFLLSLGGFRDLSLGTDADLFERAEKTGARILKVSEPTYIYHHETEDSITNMLASGV